MNETTRLVRLKLTRLNVSMLPADETAARLDADQADEHVARHSGQSIHGEHKTQASMFAPTLGRVCTPAYTSRRR